MEFVGPYTKNTSPYQAAKFADLKDGFEEYINKIPLTDEPSAAEIKNTFIKKVAAFDAVRFRMADSFESGEANYGALRQQYEREKQAAPMMARQLETAHHYMYINIAEPAFRWPVQNLDVVPALSEDLRELLILMRTRTRPGLAPNFPPGVFNVNNIWTDYKLFVDKNYEDIKKILAQVNRYTETLARKITAPIVDEPTIKFVFDTRVGLRRLPQYNTAAGEIHWFNVIYEILRWEDVRAESAINYKIARWLVYDILSHLVEGTRRNLTIYLCDDSAASLSFFFVNLGKRTCQLNVVFEFVDAVTEPPSDFQIHRGEPREQIVSSLAFYFTYFHEIWRKNTIIGKKMQPARMYETPGAVINKMTPAGSPTYFAAETVFLTAKGHFKSIKYPEMTTEEANDAIVHYSTKLLKLGKQSPGGPLVKVVAASPGVGKSTIIRAMHDYIHIDRDDIITSIKISEKTINNYIEDVEHYIDGLLTYPFMGQFKILLKHSIQLDLRGVIFANYIKAYEQIIIPEIYKIIKRNKYNMIIEGIGYEISIVSRRDLINANSCSEITTHTNSSTFYNNICQDATCSADIVYIAPVLQYNRQCLRYEAEHRVARYYTLSNYSGILWSELAREWKNKVSITCIGIGGKNYKIVTDGVLNATSLTEYLRENNVDHKFAKFLNKEYRALILTKSIRHKIVW